MRGDINYYIRGGKIFKKNCGFTLIELLVSIAIVVTLIAVFIPGFDNYKKRQGGTEVAQQIIQQVQLARSYALAPNVANFPTSDATKNIIEFAMLNNSNNNIQYVIGRNSNLSIGIESVDYIKSPTVIEGDWWLDFDDTDNLYLDNLGSQTSNQYRLTIGFQYNNADFKIFKRLAREVGETISGHDAAVERRNASLPGGNSSLPFYIVPRGKAKEDCDNLSKGCVKIDLNLITGAMTYVPYKN